MLNCSQLIMFILYRIKRAQWSTCLNAISPLFLRDGADILKLAITQIVKMSIKSCIETNGLMNYRVRPLFKKKSKLVCNYGPISILSTVHKGEYIPK